MEEFSLEQTLLEIEREIYMARAEKEFGEIFTAAEKESLIIKL